MNLGEFQCEVRQSKMLYIQTVQRMNIKAEFA